MSVRALFRPRLPRLRTGRSPLVLFSKLMLIALLLAVAVVSPSTTAAQTGIGVPPFTGTQDPTAANGLIITPTARPFVVLPIPIPLPPPPIFEGRRYGGRERLNIIPRCGVDGPSSGRVGETLTYRSTARDRDGFIERLLWYVYTPNPAERLRDGGDSIQFQPTVPGTYEVDLHIEDDYGSVNTCAVQVQVSA